MSRRGRRLPGPREWLGDAGLPWPAPWQLAPGDAVHACYAVLSVNVGVGPAGESALQLDLGDANGTITGVLTGEAPDWLRAGLYIGVRGQVVGLDGQNQILIESLGPLRVALEELELFLPRTPFDLQQLDLELRAFIDSVRDPAYHALLQRLLGPDTETGRGFRLAPAATRNHHAYLGGLLEHTLSVTRLCEGAAAVYGGQIDRDLLITAALLHDIGKVREIGAHIGFPYTDEGRLLGHILLGLQMIEEGAARIRGFDPGKRLLLQHLIASHQGRYEWQSPREPRILEAIVLHHLDDLDAKVHRALTVLQTVDHGWTAWDRALGGELLRHVTPTGERALPTAPASAATARPAAPVAGTSRRSARTKAKSSGARTAKNGGKRGARGNARRGRPRGGATAGQESSGRAAAAERPRAQGAPQPFIDRDTLDLFA